MSGHTKEPWQEAIEIGFNADTAGARTFPNWKVAEMIAGARADALAGVKNPAALPALIEAAKGLQSALACRGRENLPAYLIEAADGFHAALANLQGDAALTDGEVGNG